MLLRDALGLQHRVLEFRQGVCRVEHGEGEQEHPLVAALQLLKQLLCLAAVCGEVARQYVHVVTGAYCLLLLLYLCGVKLSELALHGLDGFHLVEGLDVHPYDERAVHLKEVREQPVIQLRRDDVEEGHGAVFRAHAEVAAGRKRKAAWRDEVLHRHTAGRELLPVELELLLPVDVEDAVHQGKAGFAVQRLGLDTELAEVVEDVQLKALKPRLRGLVALGLDTEGDVLVLDETVVASLQLVLEHLRILDAQAVVLVAAQGDDDALAVGLLVGRRVDERKLKAHRGVEVVEKLAPAVEDGVLVLALAQLVVDVLKLYGLGIEIALHTADTVREHTLERYAVLRGEHVRRALRGGDGRAHLPALAAVKFCGGRFYAPPGLMHPDAQGPHRSYSSCKAAAWGV